MSQKYLRPVMRIFNGDKKLDDAGITRLFLKQLDSIYCIKKHLVKVLPTLAEQASFSDLKTAILENADQIKIQLLRMDVIYKIFRRSYEDHNCLGVKTLSLEAYVATRIENQAPIENDFTLLVHLQIIESVEIAYFGVLKNIAGNIYNDQVKLLLDQNFESATNSKKLYELIAREYIA